MARIKTAVLLSILLLLLFILGWAVYSQTKENEQVRYSLPEHPTFSGPVRSRITF